MAGRRAKSFYSSHLTCDLWGPNSAAIVKRKVKAISVNDWLKVTCKLPLGFLVFLIKIRT